MLLLGVAAETAVILLLVRTASRSAETSQTVEAGIASRDLDSKIAAESDLCGRKTRVVPAKTHALSRAPQRLSSNGTLGSRFRGNDNIKN